MSKAGEAARAAYVDRPPNKPDLWAAVAEAAIAAHEPDEEAMRADFERLCSKNTSFGLARSRKGTYVNPAVARDWKWFQLGAIAATKAVGRQ